MGMQQILLIVLSVIIVGVAVAVGITMFGTQAVNSNRNACIADMNMFAAQSMAYYKTPVSYGGAGSDVANVDVTDVGNYIGMNFDVDADSLHNDNGGYKITYANPNLTFQAAGTETGVDPKLVLNLSTSTIETTANPTE